MRSPTRGVGEKLSLSYTGGDLYDEFCVFGMAGKTEIETSHYPEVPIPNGED